LLPIFVRVRTDPGRCGAAIPQVARSILVINGPNLNLLGSREPAIYGRSTLADIERELAQSAARLGLTLQAFQSNHEGALIDRVHAARTDGTDFIIINAGALTHTSVALRDALAAVAIAFVEVHISNVYRRERFRHRSLLSDLAVGAIVGLGTAGYRLALEFAATYSAPPAGAAA
jgi:3-dehydroquinate dehydratase II